MSNRILRAASSESSILYRDAYTAIFILSYGIWLISQMIAVSFFIAKVGTTGINLMRYAGVAGCVLSAIVSGRFSRSDIPSAFALLALCLISSRTNAALFADMFVIVYCSRYIPFGILAAESLIISVASLAATVLAAKMGLILNFTTGGIRVREYLGYLYALNPSQIIYNITGIVIYIKREKISIYTILSLILVNVYIFSATDSRLSFFISIAMLVSALLMKAPRLRALATRILGFLAPVSFLFLFIVAWHMTVNYSPLDGFYYHLNDVLGNRLALGHSALEQYGTSLLGQTVDFIGNGLNPDGSLNNSGVYNYVDCAFIRLPIQYGWLFTFLILIFFTIQAARAAKDKDPWCLLVLFAIALHCVLDDLALRLQFNTFLFLLWSIKARGSSSHRVQMGAIA